MYHMVLQMSTGLILRAFVSSDFDYCLIQGYTFIIFGVYVYVEGMYHVHITEATRKACLGGLLELVVKGEWHSPT